MSTTMTDNGRDFDPQQAATLLNQTTRQARRELEPYPVWQLATRAATALIGYGALWLSTRGQHPYLYPTAAVAPVGVVIGAINIAVVTATRKHATAGVTGRSRLHPAEIATISVVMAGVVGAMIGLIAAGVSHGIVYGLYPASVPLIAGGLTWAAIMARRGSRPEAIRSAGIVLVGVAALLAGPATAWLICAVGVAAILLAGAAFTARRQRA